MTESFDIGRFRNGSATPNQYERQLARLRANNKEVECIEKAVRGALRNLKEEGSRSFVIYGEPQSGKTEMMICLTAKLIDEGYPFVLHLLNDSVDLLDQNLGRFRESGLAPAAKNFSEILDPAVRIAGRSLVIFCKKNANDLRKLINKISAFPEIVIIDDEADYASPNAKVNKGEKTKINELISALLGRTGIYIGVTATPARLDLNNTFDNDSHLWIDFPTHSSYTGQDIFFPLDLTFNYRLTPVGDKGDQPRFARTALFGFLASVSYLNNTGSRGESYYSMLVHTSGKKADHKTDWYTIDATLTALVDRSSSAFDRYVEEIWSLCKERFNDADPDRLTHYILDNISRNTVIVLNSEHDRATHGSSATKPSTLFTIIIGGNIVSRGVTFDNLLSMFFTRDVKHKIQQDTYIQRARMFGSRGSYLPYFELTIPEQLYVDWHRCFVYHRLALSAIRDGMGSPVWLGDNRIAAVANSSIDRSTVDLDKGEMSFQIFPYSPDLENIVLGNLPSLDKLDSLAARLAAGGFPPYLRRYIMSAIDSHEDVAIHPSSSIESYKDADHKAIERVKGLLGSTQINQFPKAKHHLKIFYNAAGNARLFYKYIGSIQFIKNIR